MFTCKSLEVIMIENRMRYKYCNKCRKATWHLLDYYAYWMATFRYGKCLNH